MPTASEVAAELRRVADQFDKSPDSEIVTPQLSFYHGISESKEKFIEVAKLIPRPIEKGDGYSHDQYTLTHRSDVLRVYASIDKSKICTLVEPARPARYECTPILSLEEEQALGEF